MKTVSVIIPVYNVELYIKETLESVVSQTYKNIEIIIVNDGSTDSSLSLIQEYAKKDLRIKVINQKNKGLSGARNSGLAVASGEYLCIFDADDIMLPEKIERQVNFLEKNKDIDIVCSGVVHFFDEDYKEYILDVETDLSDIYPKLLLKNFINPNAILMRKKVYELCGGFDENLRSAEDWDYWLILARNGVRFAYIKDILTKYRIRKTSLSFDFCTMYETAIKVLEKQREYCKNNNLLEYWGVIDGEIAKRKKLLKLSYFAKKELRKAVELKVQTNILWKVIFLFFFLLPKKNTFYILRTLKVFSFYKKASRVV